MSISVSNPVAKPSILANIQKSPFTCIPLDLQGQSEAVYHMFDTTGEDGPWTFKYERRFAEQYPFVLLCDTVGDNLCCACEATKSDCNILAIKKWNLEPCEDEEYEKFYGTGYYEKYIVCTECALKIDSFKFPVDHGMSTKGPSTHPKDLVNQG